MADRIILEEKSNKTVYREGNVIARFEPTADMKEVRNAVAAAL